jgi:hypothetical protein
MLWIIIGEKFLVVLRTSFIGEKFLVVLRTSFIGAYSENIYGNIL